MVVPPEGPHDASRASTSTHVIVGDVLKSHSISTSWGRYCTTLESKVDTGPTS